MGAFPDGRAPRPKRFIAIAACIIRFSPEQRLLNHEDRLSGIMRNGQIVKHYKILSQYPNASQMPSFSAARE
jgi:hypothetical protein